MRAWALVVACALGALAACAQPALVECSTEIGSDGTCMQQQQGACAVGNGGCSTNATCMDPGNGSAVTCLCNPDFTGNGQVCAACTTCGASQYIQAPCGPMQDTTCADCSIGCPAEQFEAMPCTVAADRACAQCRTCNAGEFEAAPCQATADRVCQACTTCAPGTFETVACSPSADAVCAPCAGNCATCAGASDVCTSCPPGFALIGSSCFPTCGNGTPDPGELCDDGNLIDGDGCSSTCQIEPGFYCFGEPTSLCRAGQCIFDPLTALPFTGFDLDGAGTPGASGFTFSQRSSIYTSADLAYPILIEADVLYSTADTTFLGTRGPGLRVAADGNEPTDSLRGRFSNSAIEIAAGGQTIASTSISFAPAATLYHVRYVDDGYTARIEFLDPTNPANNQVQIAGSTFHGAADDRAFIGGGDMAGLTVRNLRACSAPLLPVTSGLTARYSAMESWTVPQNSSRIASQWLDTSGNNHHLDVNTTSPVYLPGAIQGGLSAVDFSGAAGFVSAPFNLTTDVTVFAVIQHRAPAQWGAIAHHGSRDDDWSMEQSGAASQDTLHWQTNNDDTNMDLVLTPNTDYVLEGRFAGNARDFSASTFDGGAPLTTSIVDASHTITAGSKALYVGRSDIGEASNAYIAMLVYYARALTDTERDQVIAYLQHLWLR